MPIPGEHHPAFEEYCECIFELREDNLDVIQARVADRLGVSRPSVSEMIRRMESEGLITLEGPRIALTPLGEELAERVVRRHRLAERFLTDVLGLSWAKAHHEAGKWEHIISDEVETAINRLLGLPTTCPHGNPIPGSMWVSDESVPLASVTVGQRFTVTRIPEELEFADGVLDYLEQHRIVPGAIGRVTSSQGGALVVDVDGRDVRLDPFASDRILVRS